MAVVIFCKLAYIGGIGMKCNVKFVLLNALQLIMGLGSWHHNQNVHSY